MCILLFKICCFKSRCSFNSLWLPSFWWTQEFHWFISWKLHNNHRWSSWEVIKYWFLAWLLTSTFTEKAGPQTYYHLGNYWCRKVFKTFFWCPDCFSLGTDFPSWSKLYAANWDLISWRWRWSYSPRGSGCDTGNNYLWS